MIIFEENIFFQGLLPCQDIDLMTDSVEALSYLWSENTAGVTEVLGFLPHLLAYNKEKITGIIVISMRGQLCAQARLLLRKFLGSARYPRGTKTGPLSVWKET